MELDSNALYGTPWIIYYAGDIIYKNEKRIDPKKGTLRQLETLPKPGADWLPLLMVKPHSQSQQG